MKILSCILLTIVIFTLGCEDTSNIINPIDSSVLLNNSKITNFNYELIPLPLKSPLWADSTFSVSQLIDGDVGGRIILDKYYITDNGDSISIFADLRIPPGAFTGRKNISINVDNEYAAIHFSPSMIFDDTLKLFQSFKNLDLSNYSNATLDFVYIDDEGNIELIKKNGVQVVVPQGIVRVQNAKIYHFSRFGWVRKPNNGIKNQNVYQY